MDWVTGVATVVVTVIGLWLAHSYRRQVSLKLAQTRLEAYSRLWEITGVAAPTRLDGWGDDGYLRLEERRELWAAMTDWYYAYGGGMLLTAVTKKVYLNVKHDLVCRPSDLRPAGLAGQIKEALGLPDGDELDEKVMGTLAIRLISLLRTQLKSDLAIYGPTYSDELNEYERFFLENSNVKLRSRAWATAAGTRWWALWLPRAAGGLLVKSHGSTEPGRPQPSPLLEMSAVLNVGEMPRTPPSSRTALAKALTGDAVGSVEADRKIPMILPGDRDVET